MSTLSTKSISYKDLEYYGDTTSQLGKGSFGSVYQRNKDNVCVAVKIFNPTENGLSIDSIRELTILSSISHPNVISLIDISPDNNGFAAILECATRNLNSYMSDKSKDPTKMDPVLNRKWMYELSRGLYYLHQNNIWHRDLKPHNLLILQDNRIVIADFGSSRFGVIPGGKYTGGITTLLWRPPEIILGVKDYSAEVDVFSMGTIFIELYLDNYIFGAETQEDILLRQMSILGHMTEYYWPEITRYQLYQKYKKFAIQRVEGKLDIILQPYIEYLGEDGILLLKNMTYPNPMNRIKMDQVIQSPFFIPVRDRIDIEYPASIIQSTCGYNLKLQQKNKNLNNNEIQAIVETHLYKLLFDITLYFKLTFQTFFHAKILLDMNLDKYTYDGGSDFSILEGLAIGSIYISNLMFEVIPASISELSTYSKMESSSKTQISKEYIKGTVTKILRFVQFDLNYPTVDQFMYYYLKPSNITDSEYNKTFGKIEYIKNAIELGVAYNTLSIDRISEYLNSDMVAQICSYVVLIINSKYIPVELNCLTFNDLEQAKRFMIDIEKVSDHIKSQLFTLENTIKAWNKYISEGYLNKGSLNKEDFRDISREYLSTPTGLKIQEEDTDGININKDITIHITKAKIEDVTRDDLSNFIKELLISIAVYNINNTMIKNIDEYVKYFKIKVLSDGTYRSTTYDLNRIVLSFGPLNVLTTVNVTFMYVPPQIESDIYKLLLTTNYQYSNEIMTGRISKFNIKRK